MERVLCIVGILGLAVGCASRQTVPARTPTPSPAPKLVAPEVPGIVPLVEPAVFAEFPELGYSVRIPGPEWEFDKYFTPENTEEHMDLIMGLKSERTTIIIQTYSSEDDDDVTLDRVVNARHRNWGRGPFTVAPTDYDIDDKGYFIEFSAERTLKDGLYRFRVVGARLHRLPDPIFLVIGNAPAENESFMRETVAKIIRNIKPFKKR